MVNSRAFRRLELIGIWVKVTDDSTGARGSNTQYKGDGGEKGNKGNVAHT